MWLLKALTEEPTGKENWTEAKLFFIPVAAIVEFGDGHVSQKNPFIISDCYLANPILSRSNPMINTGRIIVDKRPSATRPCCRPSDQTSTIHTLPKGASFQLDAVDLDSHSTSAGIAKDSQRSYFIEMILEPQIIQKHPIWCSG